MASKVCELCVGTARLLFGPTWLEDSHVRMERHQQNAQRIVEWLSEHDKVDRVLCPDLVE